VSYILLLEDEKLVRRLVERILLKKSYEIHSVASIAEAATALAERGCPRLIIADISLPDGDGRDFLMNAAETCPGVKSVLMSGSLEDDLPKLGFNFNGTYLPKPFDSADLRAIVEAAMRG
jgi:DNA-binding response OmpR family regulator